MKFNRTALLTAVNEALVNDQRIWEAREAKLAAEREEKRQAWLEQHGELWASAARKLLRSIKAGQPVTADMLPRDRWRSGICLYEVEPARMGYQPPHPLRRLQQVLMACADETVSTTALRDFGLTGDTLRLATQYLTRESVVS